MDEMQIKLANRDQEIILNKQTIRLETKSCRILPLTYAIKYDLT